MTSIASTNSSTSIGSLDIDIDKGTIGPMRHKLDNSQMVEKIELTCVQMNLIEKHWRSYNMRERRKIIEDMFEYIFQNYPHMKPIWVFGRGKDAHEFQKVRVLSEFKQHAAYLMKSLDTVVENLRNLHKIQPLLVNIGKKHFYYDASEPHFAVIGESLLHSFRHNSVDDNFKDDVESAWLSAYTIITEYIEVGIRKSRQDYMMVCMTPREMEQIRANWNEVNEHGLHEAGISLCGTACRAYQEMIKQYNQENEFAIDVDTDSDSFRKFSHDVINALNITIESYQGKRDGFSQLPDKLKPFCETYMGTEVSPVLVRKAFTEGLLSTLELVLKDPEDAKQHHWVKLYRVMEQGILHTINIME